MSIPDLIDASMEWSYFVANVIVCGCAFKAYRDTGKRSLMMIAISAGIAAVLAVLPFIREDNRPSWGYWGFHTVATICDLVLWVVGSVLLFRDYVTLTTCGVRSTAAPKDGSVLVGHDSSNTEKPPSAS